MQRPPISKTQIIAFGLIVLVSLLMGCQQQERELTEEQKALRMEGKRGTSMISKVKGKTEVSLYLTGLLPVATLFFFTLCTLRSF